MIPNSITKKVIEATNIVEVVSDYVSLKKKGTSYFGLCPFHDDKNPSMSVSPEKKMFNCFSCGTKGNVIYFVAKHENLTMEQATIKLAKKAGIKIDDALTKESEVDARLINVMTEAYNFYRFYLYSSEEGVNAIKYLQSRGINNEEIDEFKIGLAPKANDYLHLALDNKGITTIDQIELGLVKDVNGKFHDTFRGRIMFAITNQAGQIVGFSGRTYEKSDQAKYINSIENKLFHKGNILYHFHRASLEARKLDQIFVFEGFMDVIAAHRAGILNGVATMGTAMTNDHIRLLTSASKNIVLFFDGDEAGIKALKRSTQLLSEKKIVPYAVVLPNNLDPDEFITKYGSQKFKDFINNNMKNAYLVLYNLAYKNIYLDDFVSVEKFKQEIYQIIRLAKSEVIANYFINQLANDIKIDVEIIRKELNNVQTIDYVHDEPSASYSFDTTKAQSSIIKKKNIKITPRVIKAYNAIIKISIFSKELFGVFFETLSKDNMIMYPGAQLALQYDMLCTICNFYSENGDKDGIGSELFFEIISTKKDSYELAKEIMNDSFINIDNYKLFYDSLDTIKDYFCKMENIAIYNATIMANNDEERNKNVVEFMKTTINQKRIVNEEDM